MHTKSLLTALCCAVLLTPALSFAADDAAKAKPAEKQTVADTPFVVVAPSEEIIVSFPLFVVERGVVESIDAKDNTFTLKEKDGTMTKIKVTENTFIENVYADIFTWESKKGINDLKNLLWDALQSGNEEQASSEVELPTLTDLSDHPYYQQFTNNDEDEE
jgi:hypothetical protein